MFSVGLVCVHTVLAFLVDDVAQNGRCVPVRVRVYRMSLGVPDFSSSDGDGGDGGNSSITPLSDPVVVKGLSAVGYPMCAAFGKKLINKLPRL